MKSDSIDVIYWKIPLKELYIRGEISKKEFKKYYYLNLNDGYETKNRREEYISDAIFEILNDTETFAQLVKKETDFILEKKLSDTFEYEWGIYLYDCLKEQLISDEEYQYYLSAIDFNEHNPEDYINIINEIIEILRINMVKNDPEIISSMKNPTFNELMTANNINIK